MWSGEFEACWRLCLNQAGGSPGSVFRMSSIQLDLFCGLKGETGSYPQYSPTHLMVQSSPVFSLHPLPLHCSWLTMAQRGEAAAMLLHLGVNATDVSTSQQSS